MCATYIWNIRHWTLVVQHRYSVEQQTVKLGIFLFVQYYIFVFWDYLWHQDNFLAQCCLYHGLSCMIYTYRHQMFDWPPGDHWLDKAWRPWLHYKAFWDECSSATGCRHDRPHAAGKTLSHLAWHTVHHCHGRSEGECTDVTNCLSIRPPVRLLRSSYKFNLATINWV